MSISRLAFAASIVLLLTVDLPGQQSQPFRGGTRTVPIYATVTNSEGRLVPDLQQEHFEIYDNGQKRPITIFRSDVQPITVVMMLDTSGSMTLYLETLKDAAEQFTLRLLPDDRAKVGSFSDKIHVFPKSGFTGDRDQLVRILRNDLQFGNPTRLWDAVFEGMNHLSDETGRRVVLVFTDGDDTASQIDFDRVIERARDEQFLIYAIGLQSQFMGRVTRPDRNLRKLSDETGGGYFDLTKVRDLGAAFTRVADELHRQYVLGFTPASLDGKIHKLEVRSVVPGMTVRARRSYLAKAD
jgi:Ca-activated chloride channel family protein